MPGRKTENRGNLGTENHGKPAKTIRTENWKPKTMKTTENHENHGKPWKP